MHLHLDYLLCFDLQDVLCLSLLCYETVQPAGTLRLPEERFASCEVLHRAGPGCLA